MRRGGGNDGAKLTSQAITHNGGTSGPAEGVGHVRTGKRRVEKHGTPQGPDTNGGAFAPQTAEDCAFVNSADQAERR